MEKILQDINDTYTKCVGKLADLDAREKKTIEGEESLAIGQKALKKGQIDLNKDKTEVAKVKSVIDKETNAKKLLKEVAEKAKALEVNQSTFEDNMTRRNAELATEKVTLTQDQEILKNGEVKLIADTKKLAEKKKKIKEEVLKELTTGNK